MAVQSQDAQRRTQRTQLSRHWCFTINNPTSADGKLLDDAHVKDKVFTYIVMGKETGEDGTPHIQGYCCFVGRKRLSAVKKIMPRAHLEIMRGTPEQAALYCKKDGNYNEHGELPKTAKQALTEKWSNAYDLAKKGTIDEIPKDMLVRYYHAFKRIAQDNPVKLDDLPTTCGIWYHGPTGCGKSRKARDKYPDFYDKPLNKWWDGYRNQPYVILDDVGLDQGKWIGSLMKRWTDHYPFPAEQKGTTVQIRPKNIIVTSQYTIKEVFVGQERLQDALERRFTVINMYPAGYPFN